jgi:hypothetical protein
LFQQSSYNEGNRAAEHTSHRQGFLLKLRTKQSIELLRRALLQFKLPELGNTSFASTSVTMEPIESFSIDPPH